MMTNHFRRKGDSVGICLEATLYTSPSNHSLSTEYFFIVGTLGHPGFHLVHWLIPIPLWRQSLYLKINLLQ